jgi:hypothetical protein
MNLQYNHYYFLLFFPHSISGIFFFFGGYFGTFVTGLLEILAYARQVVVDGYEHEVDDLKRNSTEQNQ